MASVHQRYRILEKIDAGGMAEIYRAASTSIEGFERAVAIKRILPSLTQNQKFLGMFLDEARLSMQLTHANIVQILDIGKVEDTFFIAMELIDGWNLRFGAAREMMRPRRAGLRTITLEQLRLANHEPELMASIERAVHAAAEQLVTTPTERADLAAHIHFGLATGDGPLLLADWEPTAWKLPFDTITGSIDRTH